MTTEIAAEPRTKIVKRRVKTSNRLKEYTYLGCPLTRNRSPWCFRLCTPDSEGRGRCSRVAPHSFMGRIQLGIHAYNKRQFEAQCRELEQRGLAASCNAG